MISQFLLTQTDTTYAATIGVETIVPIDTVLGTILFCGPYELNKLLEDKSFVLSFAFKRVGWAYFGKANWSKSQKALDCEIISRLNSKYPDTFITDGNTFSFEDHAVVLENALKTHGVTVVSKFFDVETAILPHEFQFIMDRPEAKEIFTMVLTFLSERV